MSYPPQQLQEIADWLTDETLNAEDEIAKLKAQLASKIEECERELAEARKAKDGAYLERNRLVALLSKLFPSGKKHTAIDGWSEDWHGCVYIDFPWGQASWHYQDSQANLFNHLPRYQGEWDGHTTEEKYAAIDAARPEADK